MANDVILGIINEKGGTGKTTVAIALAGYFSSDEGSLPYLVDTDAKMGGTKNWFGDRTELPFRLQPAVDEKGRPISREDLRNVALLKQEYRPVIIDSPGHSESDLFDTVIEISDLLLLVGQPIDTEMRPVVNIIKDFILPKNKPYRILFNKIEPTRVDKAREWQTSMEVAGLHVMKNMIRRFIGHSDASRLHKHIFEMRGEAAAKQDVEDVGRELESVFKTLKGDA
jgi:chromosome partitioning protein